MSSIVSNSSSMPSQQEPSLLYTLIGLANLGNTCFLNSILQCLRLNPAIASIFVRPGGMRLRTDAPVAPLVTAFQTLMRDFWRVTPPANTNPTMVPRGFFQILKTTLVDTDVYWYTPGQQSDAGEAIQYLLDSLHEGLFFEPTMNIKGYATTPEEASQIRAIEAWMNSWSNKVPGAYKKGYSPIVRNFYGQTITCIQCDTCKNVSEQFQPWAVLKVPIPGADVIGAGAPDIDACLREAFHQDTIPDYSCTECNKRAGTKDERSVATRFDRLSKVPPVLFLQYKRTIFIKERAAQTKVRCKIACDLDKVDLTPYMAYSRNPFTNELISDVPPIYEVSAIVEQMGSAQGGHYICYVRQKDQWVEYDDSTTTPVDASRVNTQDSYILMLTLKREVPEDTRQFEADILAYRASLPPPVEEPSPA